MATSPYVYVGNVKRGDGTTGFKFKSSEDNTVYFVTLGQQIDLNAADLAKLDDRYIFAPADDEPPAQPYNKTAMFIDEGDIPIGDVLTRTARGFEFEPAGISGSWKAPVSNVGQLPSSGNTTGDVRLVIVEGMLYCWDGSDWVAISGGGGGEPPPPAVQNLFIQTTQPSGLEINALWIPVTAGVPADPEDWQVFTGEADTGSNGNLVIGPTEPTPEVDTLWIPTVADVPVQLYEWQVFSGLGNDPEGENDNLLFASTQPSSPPIGSLWVALNNDLTPKSIDNWMVNV